MTAHTRVRIVLVLVVLAAVGVTVGAWFHEQKEDDATKQAAPAADAAADGRAATRAKATATKKKGTRGGKTRVVTARAAPTPTSTGRAAAADGPSVDREAPPPDDVPDPPPQPRRSHPVWRGPQGPSYESVLGANNEQLTIGAKNGPDLTDAQLSAPMSDGSFIDDCDAPDSMGVTVKVAIRSGRAVGVTVSTSPPSAEVAGCIDHYVRGLSWPVSPKLDSLITTY